jgi:hypothetical protein
VKKETKMSVRKFTVAIVSALALMGAVFGATHSTRAQTHRTQAATMVEYAGHNVVAATMVEYAAQAGH